ncbi:hypothetical protein H4R35_005115 [Dimargaris xerosporica]|nr:hypothetical protein H4R35_005115 [Dimargaris xerosporica]
MAFRFNFTSEDLDPETLETQQRPSVTQGGSSVTLTGVVPVAENHNCSTAAQGPIERPCQEIHLDAPMVVTQLPAVLYASPAVTYTLPAEHHEAPPSPGQEPHAFTLYRRQLSDVKFQLAAEDPMVGAETAQVADATQSELTSEALMAHIESSDLVKGVYEGGMKTWECSLDLVQYLAREFGVAALENLKIMESTVHFQDYNSEVIRLVTIPNLLINTAYHDQTPSQRPSSADAELEIDTQCELLQQDPGAHLGPLAQRCRFFAGDWAHLASHLNIPSEADKYDLILTSETIYSHTSQAKLYTLIRSILKRTGTVLIAAKSMYFGLDGNVLSFAQLVESRGEMMLSTLCRVGAQVQREILKLTFK